ncbi:hypothetical protein [Streptomyces sp. NPDC058603]|uniref:hypothetical protein n=1 Tax=unclassified Streptomyces TaxID=2593676 RepID=UPI0036626C29
MTSQPIERPAATSGAPQWVGQSTFTAGTAAKPALGVDDGAGSVKVCSVALTPTGTTTTPGAVPDAARGAATRRGATRGEVVNACDTIALRRSRRDGWALPTGRAGAR